MGNLPRALPRTAAVADHVRRHAHRDAVQHQATDLLLAAAQAERSFVSGGSSAVPPALLRELVIMTNGLAGRRWLRANASSPTVETFTTLGTTPQPPALPELDRILADVLWSRFSRMPSRRVIPGYRRSTARPAVSHVQRLGAWRHRATA